MLVRLPTTGSTRRAVRTSRPRSTSIAKPGYDPTELFVDPNLRFPKGRVIKTLLKKKLGFRYLMDVIGTDPSLVKGSHGRLYDDPDAGPVFLCSSKDDAADCVDAVDVCARIHALSCTR